MTDTVDQRITLAREYLGEARGRSPGTELPRLILERELAETRRHLGQVLAVIDDQAAALAPAVLVGNYDLTLAQVDIVLAALDEAARWRELGAERCADDPCDDCHVHPAGLCEEHAEDLDKADAYRSLARELGGQR